MMHRQLQVLHLCSTFWEKEKSSRYKDFNILNRPSLSHLCCAQEMYHLSKPKTEMIMCDYNMTICLDQIRTHRNPDTDTNIKETKSWATNHQSCSNRSSVSEMQTSKPACTIMMHDMSERVVNYLRCASYRERHKQQEDSIHPEICLIFE